MLALALVLSLAGCAQNGGEKKNEAKATSISELLLTIYVDKKYRANMVQPKYLL